MSFWKLLLCIALDYPSVHLTRNKSVCPKQVRFRCTLPVAVISLMYLIYSIPFYDISILLSNPSQCFCAAPELNADNVDVWVPIVQLLKVYFELFYCISHYMKKRALENVKYYTHRKWVDSHNTLHVSPTNVIVCWIEIHTIPETCISLKISM